MRKVKNLNNRLIAMLLSTAMIFAPILESMPVYAAESGAGTEEINTGALFVASASDFSNVGGWNESIYAEIAGVKDTDVTEVSWSGAMTGELTGDDLAYLVRDNGNSGVRIDIPGLKEGTYTLTVKAGSSTLTKSDIEVYAYDRSGYAHFNYKDGVGAYNDDGTLKENAIVLYVTDENKNTVLLKYGNTTVTGIGNILNDTKIFKNLAEAGKPLVVRFIGCVSETGLYKRGSYDAKDAGKIDGLTNYAYGSDNGHMARIQSGKDITLEGIGYDAVIDGWGFHYIAKSDSPNYGKSFEVRNLTFINTPEDAVGMEGAQADKSNVNSDLSASVERCWIHHNEFYCPEITNPAEDDKAEGDGSVDFKRGQYFTCSYNYFDKCHKTNLVGADKNSLQYNLTYHHNYWYMCKARGPLSRNANIHMYNNVVEMQRDYVQNPRANSYIFSEYNLFYACSNPQDVFNEKDGNGVIKSYHDSIASVIKMDNPAEVVQNKTDYVENNCQFSARNIKYDKFDTDSSLSYIPDNNYKLDTDFTELRKVVASQTGVQKQNPKRPEEITAGEYSVVPEDTTINKIDALPKNITPGKVKTYAFTVNEAFDLEVVYKNADTAPGVLINEAGENLLTGDGSLTNLPAGTYMIQAKNFQPWVPASGSTAETAFSFKEITVNTLNITKTTAHVHKWVLDSSKSVAATCTAAGKNYYTCDAEKDGQKCDETKEEPVAALGHSWSEWTVDKPATETEAGQKSRYCTRCDAKETIPIIVLYNKELISLDIPTGTYTSDFRKNGFTITAGEGTDQSVSVDLGSEKTIDGTKYTGRLKTGGIGTKDYRSIKVTTEDTATLTMACVVATTDDECELGVATLNESGKFVEITSGITVKNETDNTTTTPDKIILSGSKGNLVTVKLPAADTYYIYSKGTTKTEGNYSGGVNFYAINVTYANGVDPVFYTVTFDSKGGLSEESQKVQAGDACVEPAEILKSGYTFDGWYADSECTQKYDFSTPVKSNLTLYAKWLAGEPDGEYLVLDMKDLPARDYKEIFKRNGFTFKATSDKNLSVDTSAVTVDGTDYTRRLKLNGAGDQDNRSISFTIEADATLTLVAASGKSGTGRALTVTNGTTTYNISNIDAAAKYTQELTEGTWKIYAAGEGVNIYYISVKGESVKAQYVITIDKQDGTEPEEKVIEEGTELTEEDLPSTLTRDGYTFQGWVDEDDNAITVPYTPTKSMTIKAKWQEVVVKNRYAITIDKQDGTESVEKIIEEGTELTEKDLPSTLTREGYIFLGWVDEDDNAITVPYTPTKSMTIKAKWQQVVVKNQYVITIDKQDGTETVEKTVVEGTELTEEDLPSTITKEGYTFLGWVDEDGNAITVPYTPTRSMTIKAKWKEVVVKNKYVIIIDKQDGTEPVEKVIEEGTELTEEDLPSTLMREGYIFQGWVDEDGNAITVPYTPAKSMTIKAKWQQNEDPKPNPGTEDDDDHIGLKVELAVPDKTYVYTGSAIKPAIIVTNNGELLTEGVDYTVKYSNNIKACEWGKNEAAPKNAPKIIVTGKGNFTGSTFANFRIEKKDIGETDITGGTASVKAVSVTVAKGSKAVPVLVYNGVKLGTKDYTYNDPTQKNRKFGDASKEDIETFEIELEGTGNYKGSRKVTVKAVKKDVLKTFTVTVSNVDLTYNGAPQLLPADAIIVKDKTTKETLKNDSEHTYYEIVYGSDTTNAGIVKFSVVGVGEYTGTVSKTYKIKPLKDNSKFYVDQSSIKKSYDYNSAGVTLGEDLEVYYGKDANGTKLQEGADYKVTYSSNKKIGKGKYTITFLGNFKGSKKTGEFDIGAASLKESGAKVEAADKVFKKAGVYKSAPYVTIDGVALKASDYKAEYYIVNADGSKTLMGGGNKVTKAGTVIEVKVTGKGSYKTGDEDSVTGYYTVCDKGSRTDLSGAKVTFYEKNADGKKGKKVTKLEYTGNAVEPAIVEVTVKGQTEPLKEGEDYTLRYVNNQNKGRATVIITAAENSDKYAGSKTATFSIVARNLKNQTGLLNNLFKIFG